MNEYNLQIPQDGATCILNQIVHSDTQLSGCQLWYRLYYVNSTVNNVNKFKKNVFSY